MLFFLRFASIGLHCLRRRLTLVSCAFASDEIPVVPLVGSHFTLRMSFRSTHLDCACEVRGLTTKNGSQGPRTVLGLQFRPYKSVILRPEIRCDYNGSSRPFEAEHSLFTAAADLIVRW